MHALWGPRRPRTRLNDMASSLRRASGWTSLISVDSSFSVASRLAWLAMRPTNDKAALAGRACPHAGRDQAGAAYQVYTCSSSANGCRSTVYSSSLGWGDNANVPKRGTASAHPAQPSGAAAVVAVPMVLVFADKHAQQERARLRRATSGPWQACFSTSRTPRPAAPADVPGRAE